MHIVDESYLFAEASHFKQPYLLFSIIHPFGKSYELIKYF